jgi:hypothetical protein
MDEMNMTLDKEESTCLRSNPMAKWKVLPQKMMLSKWKKKVVNYMNSWWIQR